MGVRPQISSLDGPSGPDTKTASLSVNSRGQLDDRLDAQWYGVLEDQILIARRCLKQQSHGDGSALFLLKTRPECGVQQHADVIVRWYRHRVRRTARQATE